MRGGQVRARGVAPHARAVDLQRSAVAARLVESRAAQEEAQRAVVVLGQQQRVLRVYAAGNVHGAARGGRNLDVAIGACYAACAEQTPRAVFGLCQRAGVVGAFAAAGGAHFQLLGGGMCGNEADHAADGRRAVEVAGAAAHQFHAVDGECRLFEPVNPAADGIVERHVVHHKQCPAGGGGPQAAQADALRRGIGNERAGAAEGFNAGNLTHGAVECEAGALAECFRRD